MNKFEDEINLLELFTIIWKRKFFVLVFTSVIAIFSVFYSLSLQNVYISSGILAPTNQTDSLSSKLGAYSGLASLTGLNLPTNTGSKTQEATERIQSFNFFTKYFLANIKLENLLAVDKWVQEGNSLIYNDKLFDYNSGKWTREVTFPKKKIPSDQEAFEKYKNILTIDTNAETGFINISIEHQSPIIAKKWVDIIIHNINESMRELDKQEAQNSIAFLNELTKSTSVQSIKEIISKLLESQMQTLMLASSEKEYVFKVIDSPIAPEKKSGPRRAFICIMGTILGGFLSLLIVFIQFYRDLIKN